MVLRQMGNPSRRIRDEHERIRRKPRARPAVVRRHGRARKNHSGRWNNRKRLPRPQRPLANLCALFVEEPYRRRGIAGELLDFARESMRRAGIPKLYLVTEHTSFYERYGWRHIAGATGDDGIKMRVYEAEC